MRLGEMDLETAAREARGNWQEFDCFGWHDSRKTRKNGRLSTLTTGILTYWTKATPMQSTRAIPRLWKRTTPTSGRNIMGTGLADGSTAMPSGFTATARLPKHSAHNHQLAVRLADYPVLNEEDFSLREYEATLDNLLTEGFDSDCSRRRKAGQRKSSHGCGNTTKAPLKTGTKTGAMPPRNK